MLSAERFRIGSQNRCYYCVSYRVLEQNLQVTCWLRPLDTSTTCTPGVSYCDESALVVLKSGVNCRDEKAWLVGRDMLRPPDLILFMVTFKWDADPAMWHHCSSILYSDQWSWQQPYTHNRLRASRLVYQDNTNACCEAMPTTLTSIHATLKPAARNSSVVVQAVRCPSPAAPAHHRLRRRRRALQPVHTMPPTPD